MVVLDHIRAERGETGVVNDAALDDKPAIDQASVSGRLSHTQMEALLEKRIELMKTGGADITPTDQHRVFDYIIKQLEADDKPLRLMVQADAGTGLL